MFACSCGAEEMETEGSLGLPEHQSTQTPGSVIDPFSNTRADSEKVLNTDHWPPYAHTQEYVYRWVPSFVW